MCRQINVNASFYYLRAVEIYEFFMGPKNEAAEKAWHNIAILYVAIADSSSMLMTLKVQILMKPAVTVSK